MIKPVLLFAHTPPPHHGQSYMVAVLLEALRSRSDAVQVFHVDCRVSESMEDLGRAGLRKVFRTLGYCVQAWRLRWQHGPMFLYYIPAPGKRGALYRDWLVMALLRPWFRGGLVLHWHALGLGEWTETRAWGFERFLTRGLLGRADLSLVLAEMAVPAQRRVFQPRRLQVLPNGIPDPCPDFDRADLAGTRRARRAAAGGEFRVLFLAHCTRQKGLYDALDAVRLANHLLAAGGTAERCRLTVAGRFLSAREQAEFESAAAGEVVSYSGFAAGPEKDRLYRESDIFIFPTWYPNEVMPVTLIEAMAYGLPIVSTRWRAIPEMLPPAGEDRAWWLTEPRRPEDTAAALVSAVRSAAKATDGALLRTHFVARYRQEAFGENFLSALGELG